MMLQYCGGSGGSGGCYGFLADTLMPWVLLNKGRLVLRSEKKLGELCGEVAVSTASEPAPRVGGKEEKREAAAGPRGRRRRGDRRKAGRLEKGWPA